MLRIKKRTSKVECKFETNLFLYVVKLYEDWVFTLNQKIELFVTSNGHQNCLDKPLEGGCLHNGGDNCLKYLRKGWNRKEGGNTNILKRGGKLGEGVGALKRGAGTPLRTMQDCQIITVITGKDCCSFLFLFFIANTSDHM